MKEKPFKHLKTGNIYYVIRDDVINCTNANDDQIMVMYRRDDLPDKVFVREKNEFFQKFEEIR